jgi:hypothetical protein
MLQRWSSQYSDLQRQVGKHLNPRDLFLWMVAPSIAFTLGISVVFAWYDHVAGAAQPQHPYLYGAIVATGYITIMAVAYLKIVRPTIQKAKEDLNRPRGSPCGPPNQRIESASADSDRWVAFRRLAHGKASASAGATLSIGPQPTSSRKPETSDAWPQSAGVRAGRCHGRC